MKGTGTQSNPFIPDNANDFVKAVTTDGSYIKLYKAIDFNAGDYYDIVSPINIKCNEIDGCGYKLDNLLTIDNTNPLFNLSKNNANIKNVVIEILGINDLNTFHIFSINPNTNVNFTNVDFRIRCKLYSDNINHVFGYKNSITTSSTISFNECIFNMAFDSYTERAKFYIFDTQDKIKFDFLRCMFNIDIKFYNKLDVDTDSDSFLFYDKTYLNQCSIIINIYNSVRTSKEHKQLTITKGQTSDSDKVHFRSTYIILKHKLSYLTKISLGVRYSIDNICFYDITSAESCFEANDVNFLALDTTQCKDAAYLESRGFIISTAVPEYPVIPGGTMESDLEFFFLGDFDDVIITENPPPSIYSDSVDEFLIGNFDDYTIESSELTIINNSLTIATYNTNEEKLTLDILNQTIGGVVFNNITTVEIDIQKNLTLNPGFLSISENGTCLGWILVKVDEAYKGLDFDFGKDILEIFEITSDLLTSEISSQKNCVFDSTKNKFIIKIENGTANFYLDDELIYSIENASSLGYAKTSHKTGVIYGVKLS